MEGKATTSGVALGTPPLVLGEAAGRRPRLSPRGLTIALVACAALVAATSVALALTSDHLRRPAATALYHAYLAAAPILIGLLWWRRRPAGRFGPLLVVLGAGFWTLAWQSSNGPVLHTIGVLLEAPFILLNFGLCLAFPTGRVRSPIDRALLAVFGLAVVQYALAQLLLAPAAQGQGVLSACRPECPPNPFQVAGAPRLLDVLLHVEVVLALAVTAGMIARFGWRIATATRPQRRALAGVAATSLLLLPAFLVYHLVADLELAGPSTVDTLGWILVAARIVFPLGFLAALIQAELFAGGALRGLLRELSAQPSLRRWRDAIAESLDDPRLALGFWDPALGEYRDPAGARVRPPAPGAGRWWVPVERDGPRAAMSVDDVLREDPELVRAACEATLVAVEQGHLQHELRASRARLVTAADAERRRLQRDLHDSAQQRLIALRVHLSLASGRIEDELLTRLGDQLDAALAELRSVVHGLYPPVLGLTGVGAALRTAFRDADPPIRVRDANLARQAQEIESTLYFCCLESVQNAFKHAGEGAHVTIELSSDATEVRLAVEDDGRGFDPDHAGDGIGLANIADRMAAIDGRVAITGAPGHGTRVEGSAPARPRDG